jgi:hypothetical protein
VPQEYKNIDALMYRTADKFILRLGKDFFEIINK